MRRFTSAMNHRQRKNSSLCCVASLPFYGSSLPVLSNQTWAWSLEQVPRPVWLTSCLIRCSHAAAGWTAGECALRARHWRSNRPGRLCLTSSETMSNEAENTLDSRAGIHELLFSCGSECNLRVTTRSADVVQSFVYLHYVLTLSLDTWQHHQTIVPPDGRWSWLLSSVYSSTCFRATVPPPVQCIQATTNYQLYCICVHLHTHTIEINVPILCLYLQLIPQLCYWVTFESKMI